jgi:DNA polymerase (family 10)
MLLNNNQQLVRIFNDMAAIYQYKGASERFRSIAYAKAANTIGALHQDIGKYVKTKTLQDLPGIGKSTSACIEEFLKNNKIAKYETLKMQVPFDLIQLLHTRGIGAQSLKKIHESANISNCKDLLKALQTGNLKKLKGWGDKKNENMLRALQNYSNFEKKSLLWPALQLAEKIMKELQIIPEIQKMELCGSLRRKKESIGDIDLLIAVEKKYRKKIESQLNILPFVEKILSSGESKITLQLKNQTLHIDMRIVETNEWGSALQYFTGSKEHNIHIRKIAKSKGYKISEYGIFVGSSGKKIGGGNEEEIYSKLELPFIAPELREDTGEIESAINKELPILVTASDIKGDLQMHSNWSDGTSSIEEIANYVKSQFHYEYIAITDHSKSSRIANGLNENDILKQINTIASINEKRGENFIKCGIEVDILRDGSLDISDDVLSQLDWVCASIHSHFKQNNTERILRAIENKWVCCIGHPSGRLIGRRDPYPLNMDLIFAAAKKNNTALEINAQCERMDLNDHYSRQAQELGVPLVISTDSHNLSQFKWMEMGIAIARRGWCSADNILNTRKWKDIETFRKRKTKKELP